MVDVGGGSSELVIGNVESGVRWWASVALGSGGLTYADLHADPPPEDQLRQARARIAATLSRLDPPRPRAAIAVGGSATSLALVAGPRLDAAGLGRALDLLTGAPAARIAARFGIDEQRARLLPAGLLILQGVTELFGVGLRVGRGGIREGVLLEAGAA